MIEGSRFMYKPTMEGSRAVHTTLAGTPRRSILWLQGGCIDRLRKAGWLWLVGDWASAGHRVNVYNRTREQKPRTALTAEEGARAWRTRSQMAIARLANCVVVSLSVRDDDAVRSHKTVSATRGALASALKPGAYH